MLLLQIISHFFSKPSSGGGGETRDICAFLPKIPFVPLQLCRKDPGADVGSVLCPGDGLGAILVALICLGAAAGSTGARRAVGTGRGMDRWTDGKDRGHGAPAEMGDQLQKTLF